jgi:hypothetical protein
LPASAAAYRPPRQGNDNAAEVFFFCYFLDLLVVVYAVETMLYADELLHEPKHATFF